jgi:hypothetical protein
MSVRFLYSQGIKQLQGQKKGIKQLYKNICNEARRNCGCRLRNLFVAFVMSDDRGKLNVHLLPRLK